jgi:hypothetical protein
VERNRRDVEEKSEQLKALANMAALIAGFSLVAFLQVGGGVCFVWWAGACVCVCEGACGRVGLWVGGRLGRVGCVCLPHLGSPIAAAESDQPSAARPQFDWTGFVDRTGALLPLFGATMALTVGFDMIAVIICTLMLVRWVT